MRPCPIYAGCATSSRWPASATSPAPPSGCIAAGDAVAIVGESAATSLPAGLVWRPLSPVAALETALVVAAHSRPPAVERFASLATDAASELGWR
jgi:DNA-binding transcriptional LysR family regulator